MARSGMVRLGPVALVLALAGCPARAALMHYEFSGVVAEAPAGSPLLGSRFSGSFAYDDAPPDVAGAYPEAGMETSIYRFGTHRPDKPTADGTGVEVRLADGLRVQSEGFVLRANTTIGPDATSSSAYIEGDMPGWPGRPHPEYVLGLAFGAAGRLIPLGGPIPADWTLDDFSEARFHLLRRAYPWPPAAPYDLPDVDSYVPFAAGTIDSLSATPIPEPPLTLAFMLGVSAWALHRRFVPRRSTGRVRARRVAPPVRPPGTAMVLASRPRPIERHRADRPPMLEIPATTRPLVLAANFVEISTRTGPPALPAWRTSPGASAVAVRRRGSLRRVGA